MRKKMSYTDVHRLIRELERTVFHDWTPTAIMGIHGGGGNPAITMATSLGADYIMLEISKYSEEGTVLYDEPKLGVWYQIDGEQTLDPRKQHHDRLLIVDDVLETGDTMALALDHAKQISDDVRIFTLTAKPKFHNVREFMGHTLHIGKKIDNEWIKMPWENI